MSVLEKLTIDKNKAPKGYSHVIQTSDILPIITDDMADIGCVVRYKRQKLPYLLRVEYHGQHHAEELQKNHIASFYIEVGSVASPKRDWYRSHFTQTILRNVGMWLNRRLNAEIQCDGELKVEKVWRKNRECIEVTEEVPMVDHFYGNRRNKKRSVLVSVNLSSK